MRQLKAAKKGVLLILSVPPLTRQKAIGRTQHNSYVPYFKRRENEK